jgi:hypothetical protein
MVSGVLLATTARLVARKNRRPRFYAQIFIPDVEGEKHKTESLKYLLESRARIRFEQEWPPRFTFGRGGGPGLEPPTIFAAIALTLAVWYGQGVVGAIGADHWQAIRDGIRDWLTREKVDQFYLCVESATGQQVRALFPKDTALFLEAWDALDEALRQLPKLSPDGFCLIEWDLAQKRWIQPLS